MTKKQEKQIESVLIELTSAYQENAVMSTVDYIAEYGKEEAQKFADDCCENYRAELKQAGYADQIYEAFINYGEELEVQEAAFKVFAILKQPSQPQKKAPKADIIGEALTSKGLYNNEHNRAEIIAKVEELGESVKALSALTIEPTYKTAGLWWVWLYFKNGKGALYDKQGGRGFSLSLEEMTTHQKIENLLNSKKWKNAHAKSHITANGWKCERVKNNKPATLQELAETLRLCNYLYYFLFVEENSNKGREYFRLTGWDTLTKRATPANCPWSWLYSSPYNLKSANEARINAVKVYLLKAPKSEGEIMQAKRNERAKRKGHPFTYREKIPTERVKLDDVRISWYHTNYNSFGWRAYAVDGIAVFHDLETRETKEEAKREALALIYDKNGYRKGERIEELKRQVKENKARRLANEWENTNKGEYVHKLEEIERAIIGDFQRVANSGAYDFYTLHRLQDIGECVRDVQKVKENISTYKSAAMFHEDLSRCQRLAKKCHILAPLHADPKAYGFSWWHLEDDGSLTNTYETERDYYISISADSVGTSAKE